jgi:hypothetical protein
MALDMSLLDADVEFIISDLPESMTFSSVVYSVTRTILSRSDLTEREGLREQYRFSVYCQASDFGTLPDVDDIVTVNGTDFLVLDTQLGPAEQVLRLDLGEEYGV